MLYTKGFIAVPAVIIVMSFLVLSMIMRGSLYAQLSDIAQRTHIRSILAQTTQVYAEWTQSFVKFSYLGFISYGTDLEIIENDTLTQEFSINQRKILCKRSVSNTIGTLEYMIKISCTAEPFGFGIQHIRYLYFDREKWGMTFKKEINFFTKI